MRSKNCFCHTCDKAFHYLGIAETSVAKVYYIHPDSYHETTPGDFYVYDKLTDRMYHEISCYDGGQGMSNKDESDAKSECMNYFIGLNKRYHKILTDADRKILEEINKPVTIEVKNRQYWG